MAEDVAKRRAVVEAVMNTCERRPIASLRPPVSNNSALIARISFDCTLRTVIKKSINKYISKSVKTNGHFALRHTQVCTALNSSWLTKSFEKLSESKHTPDVTNIYDVNTETPDDLNTIWRYTSQKCENQAGRRFDLQAYSLVPSLISRWDSDCRLHMKSYGLTGVATVVWNYTVPYDFLYTCVVHNRLTVHVLHTPNKRQCSCVLFPTRQQQTTSQQVNITPQQLTAGSTLNHHLSWGKLRSKDQPSPPESEKSANNCIINTS
jgi:hypothetical protein